MRNWVGFKTMLRHEVERMFKTPAQSFFPPIISSVLFILIFGFFIGDHVAQIEGTEFVQFFIPGLIMMNVIITAYSSTAFSLFLKRFLKDINDLLVTPLSYSEIVLGFVTGGIVRALIVGTAIYLIAQLFTPLPLHNFFLFLFFMTAVSLIFSCLGILIGLWAETFEQVEIFTVFLITPLTFLGGVFHSIKLLPSLFQQLSFLNPLFYMIDGLRYAILGKADGNIWLGILIVSLLGIILFYANMQAFKKGWKLRT